MAIVRAIEASRNKSVGAISSRFNIDFYPDARQQDLPGMRATGHGQKATPTKGLRRLLDNIGAADAKTRARILRVYNAAYKKQPGSKKLLHVINYIKRMNKAGRKMKRTTRKVII